MYVRLPVEVGGEDLPSHTAMRDLKRFTWSTH